MLIRFVAKVFVPLQLITNTLANTWAKNRTNNQSPTAKAIRPIDVIEGWVLCQHLGWVVKYLARATSPDSLLEQTCLGQARLKQARLKQTRLEQARQRLNHLENAEWYLERELARFPRCTLIPMVPHSITTKQVIKDWGLSFHLGKTLFYLKTSLSSYRRKEALERAIEHLKEEIRICKTECGFYEHENNKQQTEGGK